MRRSWTLLLAALVPILAAADAVRDISRPPYNASPAGDPTANRLAIQKALDDPAPAGLQQGIRVVVPPGRFPTDGRPLWMEQHYTSLAGVNRDVSWIINDGHNPLLLIGMSRTPMGVALTPDHFFPLAPLLDGSVGQRYGFLSKADSHIAMGPGPFMNGPRPIPGQTPKYWADVSSFTVDWGVQQDMVPFRQGPQFGMYFQNRAYPWAVSTNGVSNGSWALQVQVVQGGADRQIAVMFPAPLTGGNHKLTASIDLVNRKILGYVDGFQVMPVGATAWGPPAQPLTLYPNRGVPFMAASQASTANTQGSDWIGGDGHFDRAYLGIHVSRGLRYADNGVGKPQVRADGGVLNDAYRWFTQDPDTIAALDFARSPTDVAADRCLDVVSGVFGTDRTTALVLSKEHGDLRSVVLGCSVRDISLVGQSLGSAYGSAVTTGFALDLQISGARLHGGAHGLGTWNWGTNYPTRVRDTELLGTDAGVYNYYGILTLDRVNFPSVGRTAIHGWWSGIDARNLFFTGFGQPETLARLYGCKATFTAFQADFEGAGYPSVASFWSTAQSDASRTGGWLRLRDWVNGNTPNSLPLVVLDQVGNAGPARFDLDGLEDYGEHPAVVDVKGTAWRGLVRHDVPYVTTPVARYIGVPPGTIQAGSGTVNPVPPVPVGP